MTTPYERCNELQRRRSTSGSDTPGQQERTPGTTRRRRTMPHARRKSKATRPNHTPFEKNLAIVINANAVLQLFVDVVLEALHLLPSRINHLSLTFLNAFIAFKTLSAVQKGKFQFLHEDCQVLWIMEVCLIMGDIYYMFYDGFKPLFIYLRLFFLICSMFNWLGVTYIMWRYNLWHITYQGEKKKDPRGSLSERMLKSLTSFWHQEGEEFDLHNVGHDPNDPVLNPPGHRHRQLYNSSLRSNLSSNDQQDEVSHGAAGGGSNPEIVGSPTAHGMPTSPSSGLTEAVAVGDSDHNDDDKLASPVGNRVHFEDEDAEANNEAKPEDDPNVPIMPNHAPARPQLASPRKSFFSPSTSIDFGDDFGAQSDSDIGGDDDDDDDQSTEGDYSETLSDAPDAPGGTAVDETRQGGLTALETEAGGIDGADNV